MVTGWVILQCFGNVGADIAGRDGVDLDSMRRPFIGQRLGQLADAALAGRIARHGDAALKGEQGSDKDDFAAPARQHPLAEFAAKDKLRVEVDGDDFVPIGI